MQPDSVTIENGPAFGCVVMKDFLKALSKRLKWNKTAYEMCSYRAFEGDSWFNCQKLKLPSGCRYEFQMQYGSIGWSVGATLGYARAAPTKRVIAFIGDGSFQVTAQDVSKMTRSGQRSIIFLINNGGYTIEVEIHDGPYNEIKNWKNIS
ncbi:unnamed protein product [Prunus armeniaca]